MEAGSALGGQAGVRPGRGPRSAPVGHRGRLPAEIGPEFVAEIRRVVEEPSLFTDDSAARLDALRPNAAAGLERRLLDGVCFISESEAASFETIQAALAMAARRCAETRALQIEEHFVRRSKLPRARDMRGRLDATIDLTNFTKFAARILSVDPETAPQRLQSTQVSMTE